MSILIFRLGSSRNHYYAAIRRKIALVSYEGLSEREIERQLKRDRVELKEQIKDLLEDVKLIQDKDERDIRGEQLKILLDGLYAMDSEEDINSIQDQLDEIINQIQGEEKKSEEAPYGYAPPESGQPSGPQKNPSPGSGMHPQDDSTEVLSDCVRAGYTHAVWNLHENHPKEDICDQLHATVFSLQDLLIPEAGLQHNAPIFERSHVGCGCWLLVYSEYDADLPWVICDFGGRWA